MRNSLFFECSLVFIGTLCYLKHSEVNYIVRVVVGSHILHNPSDFASHSELVPQFEIRLLREQNIVDFFCGILFQVTLSVEVIAKEA